MKITREYLFVMNSLLHENAIQEPERSSIVHTSENIEYNVLTYLLEILFEKKLIENYSGNTHFSVFKIHFVFCK